MSNVKCPVCGNPGIPNYLQEDVVCPHCGSDLKIYKTLSEIGEEESSSCKCVKKYKILTILLPILSILIVGIPLYLILNKTRQETENQLKDKEITITQLKDSVSILSAKVESMKVLESSAVEYVIVRNDCPWKIVHKFYGIRGDWKELSRKIANDNGIWDESSGEWKPIYPGQVLKINK
jgi:nucleoid-associated protein YgaU